MTEASVTTQPAHVGYVFTPDAYYWPALGRTERDMLIGSYHDDGTCEWEFTVVERRLPGAAGRRLEALIPTADPGAPPVLGLQVCIFDDGWDAYTELPEFFTGLAALAKSIRAGRTSVTRGATALEAVRDLCDALGYLDRTPRKQVAP